MCVKKKERKKERRHWYAVSGRRSQYEIDTEELVETPEVNRNCLRFFFQAIPSRQNVFYTMGTVRAEARVVIGAKMDSYDAEGNLIKSQPASSSQVSEVRTSRQRDPGHHHSFRKMNPKHKKNTHRGKH